MNSTQERVMADYINPPIRYHNPYQLTTKPSPHLRRSDLLDGPGWIASL